MKSMENLLHLDLNLTCNKLGVNVENMKSLGERIKNLPNLCSLNLYLEYNKLGINIDNMKFLGEGLKYL